MSMSVALLGLVLIFTGLALAGMRAGYWLFVVGVKTVVTLAVVVTVGAWFLTRYRAYMRPVYRAILSLCTALVNVGLTTSGYTNFYLACVLWAIAAALALSIAVPWLAGMWLTPISATNEQPQKM